MVGSRSPAAARRPHTMRTTLISTFLCCALLAPEQASAQVGVAVDLGPAGIHGAPSAAHGAAAGVGGFWNEIDTDVVGTGPFPVTVTGLVDSSGATSGITVTLDDLGSGMDAFLYDDPATSGGADALLDDLAFFGGAATLEIRGLVAGQYEVYTYATVPDGAAHQTRVRVVGSPDPSQDVGGAFAGGYALGVTHARHQVTVTAGSAVVIRLDVAAEFMSVNGFQIVPFGATGDIGTTYCSPGVLNASGNPGEISAFGSPRRVSNDVTLTASSLPQSSFGFFLTSQTQGFVVAPGGSLGNLCLGGSIGRYVGPGQVQNSGAAGAFSLAIDLANTPTPTGLVSIAPGETWSFQAWYRDSVLGFPASNLTDGLAITFL